MLFSTTSKVMGHIYYYETYDDYFLGRWTSCYLPAMGECEKCPLWKKCNGGEKCLNAKNHNYKTP